MAITAKHNPYTPGIGIEPVCLAGRQEEQRVLAEAMARIQDKLPGNDHILIGPRGNGKTTLLRWFDSHCKGQANAVDVVWLTPAEIQDIATLTRLLTPRPKLKLPLLDSLSVSIIGSRLIWGKPAAHTLTRLLTARCRTTPLVLLLDEAHTLHSQVGQVLLNVSQEVRAAAPFLLVLAGTPGLQSTLANMQASFWDRAEQLFIGLLPDGASEEILVKTGAVSGLQYEPDALDQLVIAGDRYPYFVQLLGRAAWKQARQTQRATVDRQAAETAIAEVKPLRYEYYRNRLAELEHTENAAPAYAVAKLLDEKQSVSDWELNTILQQVSADHGDNAPAIIKRNKDTLYGLGLIWRDPGADEWTCGIPSLAGYVADRLRPGLEI